MKKAVVLIGALSLLLFLAQAPAQAQVKLGFKVTGGLAYIGGGDVNTGLQGWSDVWKDVYSGAGYTAANGYSPVRLGMDVGGEILLQFSPRLALGLGAGYIQASKESALNVSHGSTSFEESWAPNISAVPITATLYYYLPTSGKIKLFLDAGIGYYLGSYKDSWHVVFIGSTDDSYDTTANGIGFHGGLGLEVPLSPAISLLFEARGRYASLGNFKGTMNTGSWNETGNLWIQHLDSDTVTYPVLVLDSSTPASDFRPVQAKLGLGGFSAVLGFLFHF